MDYIEDSDGRMLSESWEELHHDSNRRTTLFRDISRIILALGQSPMPRIGSLTIDNQSVLSLTNRPLTCQLQIMENEGIPTNIDRNLTYSNTDTYLLDLLAYHDNRIRYQPNSIRDEFDGRAQMATLAMMRALLPNFVSRDLRHGPFVFSLTDLHQSNILVDSDWHIKCLIDLEWACSLPIEMQHPPYWLTGRAVDELQKGQHLTAFTRLHEEFIDAFEKEERLLSPTKHGTLYRTNIMTGWKIGNFWYFHALDSPKGIYNLFLQHIQPRFAPSHDETEFDRTVAPYWATDADEVIASKIKDIEVYTDQLRKVFGGC
jgi:Phosphotransferase enzyme family